MLLPGRAYLTPNHETKYGYIRLQWPLGDGYEWQAASGEVFINHLFSLLALFAPLTLSLHHESTKLGRSGRRHDMLRGMRDNCMGRGVEELRACVCGTERRRRQ
jgi:hypothetical protein